MKNYTTQAAAHEAMVSQKPTNVQMDLKLAHQFIDRHLKKHPNDLPEQRQFNLITTKKIHKNPRTDVF